MAHSATDPEWADLRITGDHAAWLAQHAVTPATAKAAGVYSISSTDDLPPGTEWVGQRGVPGLVIPWRSPSGRVEYQLHPDTPIDVDDQPRPYKYVWPKGHDLVLNQVHTTPGANLVLLIEGTKQPLAAASYAPDGCDIYGMHGCQGWMQNGVALQDLDIVDDRDVIVIMDGDVATNLDVHEAARRLAEAAGSEGADSVRFVVLPTAGSAGLDDVLARTSPDKRGRKLANLIKMAKLKLPAKPRGKAPKREAAPAAPVTTDRPRIVVNQDRLDVINDLTAALLARWDGRQLFNHGNVLSFLGTHGDTGAPEMRPVTKPVFLDLIQQTVATMSLGGDTAEPVWTYAWPDPQTIDATLSRHRQYTPLRGISRAPFVRPDGSVCQVNGYDPDSRTMVIMDDALASIRVPNDPTDTEIALARKLLIDDWLGDMPFATNADRANALGLTLTLLIRGLVDVVPMAVIDGLQMGVGKNLLADINHILATGAPAKPMPLSHDDEEVRKGITSAFRGGTSVICYDEAHTLDSPQLARALTSSTYTDRQLGVSHLLEFPNQVTWMSLGNKVRVEGDVIRRVYRIALHTTGPNPQDRPATSFRHPDLRAWTKQHRAELLTAALTLIRAWFASGRPVAAKGVTFGSFEQWDRIVGGIVERAGVPEFLANMQEWRSESNVQLQYWTRHIDWLRETFGPETFTCAQARAAMVDDRGSEPPPGMTDLTGDPKDYNRRLGQSYAKMADRHLDGLQLVKADRGKHGHVTGWRVITPDDLIGPESTRSPDPEPDDLVGPESTCSPDPEPVDRLSAPERAYPDLDVEQLSLFLNTRPALESTCLPDSDSSDGPGSTSSPDLGGSGARESTDVPDSDRGSGGLGGNPLATRYAREKHFSPVACSCDYTTGEHACFARIGESCSPSPEPPFPPAGEHVDSPQPTYKSGEHVVTDPRGTLTLPPDVVAFDIETTGKCLWPVRDDFIRITGYQVGNEIRVTDDAAEAARVLSDARLIIGHNIMSFDLVAFALHHGIDLHKLADEGRVVDTQLTEVLVNPPAARTPQGQIMREVGLDALGQTKLGVGKTGDLGVLAREFGGYDQIPVDDPRYMAYCAGDVDLTARLSKTQGRSAYAKREHRVAALAAKIRMNGFRVDIDLLTERVAAGKARRAELVGVLVDKYGMPLADAKGVPFKAPQSSAAGKEAIVQAFADLGVKIGRTPKSGGPALGKDAMQGLLAEHADNEPVRELAELVGSLNGVRSVYETVERCRVGDRVHPNITMYQASGRWSITEPGLTVMGKRNGKHVERAIFLPEVGHVIIAADLSQVDARAVAAWCQDPAYLALFEPGRDSHTEIALAVWGDAGRRDDAKVIGHGWNYGMGIGNLAQRCGSETAAREFDRAMRERFPGLVEWKRQIAERADKGELLDNGFGRLLRTTPGCGWTQGPALMGQSAARDILMEGLLRLPAYIRPMLRAVVHDEVVLSVPEDRVDQVEQDVLDALQFPWTPPGAAQSVGIAAGLAKRGGSWADCYEK